MRHRLNHHGDRRANNVLFTVMVIRMRIDERTRAHATRRTAEGLESEIIRCLRRYVAREVHRELACRHQTPRSRPASGLYVGVMHADSADLGPDQSL